MEIKVAKEANVTVLTITGRMDAVTAPQYEKELNSMVAAGETLFVVDFYSLEYISSAGLRALLATAKLLKGKGGQICFARVSGTVKEVFDISGFASIFKMDDSVSDAIARIG